MKVKSRKRFVPRIRTGDDPVLSKPCQLVDPVWDDYRGIIKHMRGILYASQKQKVKGVGLAANQIGFLSRIILVKHEGGFYAMVNPEIVKRSEETEVEAEGCLFYPGRYVDVSRPKEVTIKYITEDWKPATAKLTDMEARITQHEMDHLDGRCKVRPEWT